MPTIKAKKCYFGDCLIIALFIARVPEVCRQTEVVMKTRVSRPPFLARSIWQQDTFKFWIIPFWPRNFSRYARKTSYGSRLTSNQPPPLLSRNRRGDRKGETIIYFGSKATNESSEVLSL